MQIGLILGTAFNNTGIEKIIFSMDAQETLGLISVFGYVLFLFYIGVKTDMSMVHRTGRKAMTIGAIAIMAPFFCGMVVQYLFSSKYLDPRQRSTSPFVIGLLSLSPFPVISSVLSDLRILNSELGRLGLSSALVSEMLSIFLAVIVAFFNILLYYYGTIKPMIDLAAVVGFIIVLVFVFRPAMFWIIRHTPEGCPVNDHYVYSIFILVLLSAYASHHFNFLAVLGPYLLGLAIPEGPPLGTAIIKKIDTFVNGVLMPIFVTTCSMRVDLKVVMKCKKSGADLKVDPFMIHVITLVVVTHVSKFVACMIPPLYCRMPFKHAVILSLIMSCKGIVEIAASSFLRDISVCMQFLTLNGNDFETSSSHMGI